MVRANEPTSLLPFLASHPRAPASAPDADDLAHHRPSAGPSYHRPADYAAASPSPRVESPDQDASPAPAAAAHSSGRPDTGYGGNKSFDRAAGRSPESCWHSPQSQNRPNSGAA